MRYVLDTDMVADMVQPPRACGAARPRGWRSADVTSITVAAELRYGGAKTGSQRLSSSARKGAWRSRRSAFEVLADATYGMLRARLERIGAPIGGNDLLIAAQVIALGHAIVTDNEREFARIDDLPCENWLRQV
jgi:tRNA(fMet)-specific endonuclease VapC